MSASVGGDLQHENLQQVVGIRQCENTGNRILDERREVARQTLQSVWGARVSVAELGRGESRYLDALLPWHDTECEGITMRACVWRKWVQDGKAGLGECFLSACGCPTILGALPKRLEGEGGGWGLRAGPCSQGRRLLQLFSVENLQVVNPTYLWAGCQTFGLS